MIIEFSRGPADSRAKTPRRGFAGFTLVELLVTLVVLSVGLLGIAALHTATLRNNLDSSLRSQASALAADIADRMRSNRTAALGGAYNITFNDGAPAIPTGSPLATRDLNAWKTTLSQVLPAGNGEIATNGNVVTIRVRWGERSRNTSTTTAQNVTFETRTQI